MDTWNEETIKARALKMAEQATDFWPSADLAVDVLKRYKPQAGTNVSYGYDDHPYLAREHVNALFAALRKATLALDPCVTELFLKLYIAYKAEVNFVDVITQAKRLLLCVNIPFADLNDPRGLCRDVSNLGRWGNGSVELAFERIEDLPYVMSIVTQAFERQMDN